MDSIRSTLADRLDEPIHVVPGAADLPVDLEGAVAILEGLIELLEPAINDLVSALNDWRALEGEFNDTLKRTRDAAEKAEMQENFTEAYEDCNMGDLLGRAKTRQRTLAKNKADAKVLLQNKRQALRHAAPAAAAAPAAPAIVAQNFPKTELPTFRGDLQDFASFWQLFCTLVDLVALPVVQKFSILKTKLEGEPLQLISGLEITDANYAIAKDLLTRKYADQEAVMRKLRQEIYALKPCRDMADVKNLYLKVEGVVRQMENLLAKAGKVLDGSEILFYLETKLPSFVLEKMLTFKKAAARWDLKEFRSTLASLVSDHEQVKMIASTFPKMEVAAKNSNVKPGFRNRNTRNFSAVVVKTNPAKALARAAVKNYPVVCIFCEEKHMPRECPLSLSERKRRVMVLQLCFLCLKTGHQLKDCKARACSNCGGRHHFLICSAPLKKGGEKASTGSMGFRFPKKQINTTGNKPDNAQPKLSDPNNIVIRNASSGVACATMSSSPRTLFMTVYAQVGDPEKTNFKNILVFIDTGSSDTYITQKLEEELGLSRGLEHRLTISRFGDGGKNENAENSLKIESHEVKFVLRGLKGQEILVTGFHIKTIMAPTYTIPADDVALLTELNVRLPPARKVKPEVLLGIEYFTALQLSFWTSLPSGLSIYTSTLGPIVCGKNEFCTEKKVDRKCRILVNIREEPDENDDEDKLFDVIDQYLQNESCDFGGEREANGRDEDEMVLERFEQSTVFIPNASGDPLEPPGRYQVRLPWKDDADFLPDNYALTQGRYRSTLKRLRANPPLLKMYDDTMKSQIASGVLELVPHQLTSPGRVHLDLQTRVYYIPHQPVLKESSSTTKLRVVFDASSGRPSLNSCLFRGRVYAGQNEKNIASILIRVRFMQHVLCMDLEKAFLQVLLHPEDRDVCRILWADDPVHDEFPRIYRFTRVTFGLAPAPFLLGATVEKHLRESKSKWSNQLIRGSYVDNYLVPLDSPKQILTAVAEIRALFWEGGFNCRQFLSNCIEQIDALPEEWREEKRVVSLLGIQWDLEKDNFIFKLPVLVEREGLTKRKVLAFMAKTFDPNGWISPILHSAKVAQAEIWAESSSNWDGKLPNTLTDPFVAEIQKWEGLTMEIPRRAVASPLDSRDTLEIHAFSDASIIGLGVAVYIRRVAKTTTESSLVFARSLVVPTNLKPKRKADGSQRAVSVPRLELQALVLAQKAAERVKEHSLLPVEAVTLWTDSTIIISYLKNFSEKDIFIRNRLSKVRSYLVRHVATEQNPADIGSRGSELVSLVNSKLWWHGPRWLSEPESVWPHPQVEYDPAKRDEYNKIVDQLFSIECQTASAAVTGDDEQVGLYDLNKTNRYYKALRIVAFVLIFLKTIGIKIKPVTDGSSVLAKFWENIEDISLRKNKQKGNKGVIQLNREDIGAAEYILIRQTQNEFPPEENSKLNLGLFAGADGLWRCRGRFQHSPHLSDQAKFPIYLDKKAPLTALIIKDLHIFLHHCGPGVLIAEFRQKFWTARIKAVIRRVLHTNKQTRCLPCYIQQVKPYLHPAEPPLPSSRLTEMSPFQAVGVDFFGPMKVKVEGSILKSYCVIFSCMVVRAIHLELVSDMSVEKFLMALRRMISRRGVPLKILSDNARTFLFSGNYVEQNWHILMHDPKLLNFAAKRSIVWTHTTERAPWTGSIYERLIQSIKFHWKRAVGKKVLGTEETLTILLEIENIINSRPLSAISEQDVVVPIRPVNFLRPLEQPVRSVDDAPSDIHDPDFLVTKDREAHKLVKVSESISQRTKKFWEGWRNEYLNELRNKWRGKSDVPDMPHVGEIVLVAGEEEVPRSHWRLARVLQLLSKRTALIKMQDGLVNRRSVSHLYPLEMTSEEEEATEVKPAEEEWVEGSEGVEGAEGLITRDQPEREKRISKKKRDPDYYYESDMEYDEGTSSHRVSNSLAYHCMVILLFSIWIPTASAFPIENSQTSYDSNFILAWLLSMLFLSLVALFVKKTLSEPSEEENEGLVHMAVVNHEDPDGLDIVPWEPEVVEGAITGPVFDYREMWGEDQERSDSDFEYEEFRVAFKDEYRQFVIPRLCKFCGTRGIDGKEEEWEEDDIFGNLFQEESTHHCPTSCQVGAVARAPWDYQWSLTSEEKEDTRSDPWEDFIGPPSSLPTDFLTFEHRLKFSVQKGLMGRKMALIDLILGSIKNNSHRPTRRYSESTTLVAKLEDDEDIYNNKGRIVTTRQRPPRSRSVEPQKRPNNFSVFQYWGNIMLFASSLLLGGFLFSPEVEGAPSRITPIKMLKEKRMSNNASVTSFPPLEKLPSYAEFLKRNNITKIDDKVLNQTSKASASPNKNTSTTPRPVTVRRIGVLSLDRVPPKEKILNRSSTASVSPNKTTSTTPQPVTVRRIGVLSLDRVPPMEEKIKNGSLPVIPTDKNNQSGNFAEFSAPRGLRFLDNLYPQNSALPSHIMNALGLPYEAGAPLRKGEKAPLKVEDFYFCRAGAGTLWRVPLEDPLCTEVEKLSREWTNGSFYLYSKTFQAEPIPNSYVCLRKVEKITAYVNLLGDTFTQTNSTLIAPSADECRHWLSYKSCAEGTLVKQNTKLYQTHNKIRVNWPSRWHSFWSGAEETEATTNCFLEPTALTYLPNTFGMNSALYDMRSCNFTDGTCVVDNKRFIWPVGCGTLCTRCHFMPIGTMSGSFTKSTFLSSDRQLVLSFESDPELTTDCEGNKIVVSSQGYAIRLSDYQTMLRKGSARTKREIGTTEELAGEISALELRFTKFVEHVVNQQCHAQRRTQADPTLTARNLLQRADVTAKWRTDTILEVFSCATVKSQQVKLRQVKDTCYKFVPVTVTIADVGEIAAFLDPVQRILSESSAEADCRLHMSHLIEDENGVAIFNTWTGNLTRLNPRELQQIPPGVTLNHVEQDLSFFHDFVLGNDTQIIEELYNSIHVAEMERINNFKDKALVEDRNKAAALSAQPHTAVGLIKGWFMAWLSFWVNLWVYICCAIVTVVTLSGLGICFLPGCVTIPLTKLVGWMRSKGRHPRGPFRPLFDPRSLENLNFQVGMDDLAERASWGEQATEEFPPILSPYRNPIVKFSKRGLSESAKISNFPKGSLRGSKKSILRASGKSTIAERWSGLWGPKPGTSSDVGTETIELNVEEERPSNKYT